LEVNHIYDVKFYRYKMFYNYCGYSIFKNYKKVILQKILYLFIQYNVQLLYFVFMKID